MRTLTTEINSETYRKLEKAACAKGFSSAEGYAASLAAAATSRRPRTGRARQQGRDARTTTPTKSRQSQGARFSVALTEREARLEDCPAFYRRDMV